MDADGVGPRAGNLLEAGLTRGAQTSSSGAWWGRSGKVLGTEHCDGPLLEGLGHRLREGLEEGPRRQA